MTTSAEDGAVAGGSLGICHGERVLRRQDFSSQFYLPQAALSRGNAGIFDPPAFAPGET